jgi:hypothetical protein
VIVLSGGARGVDRCAVEAARARGLRFLEYKADWNRDGRYPAGRIRNQRVAEDCDRMVAFWDGRSTGTHDAWQRALDLRRPLVLYRLRSVALVGTLTAAPAVEAPNGTPRAELTLVVPSPIARTYRIAACGDLVAAVAGLPAGKRLRVRAACRQVFRTDGAEVLRQHRPATYEARGIKRLPGRAGPRSECAPAAVIRAFAAAPGCKLSSSLTAGPGAEPGGVLGALGHGDQLCHARSPRRARVTRCGSAAGQELRPWCRGQAARQAGARRPDPVDIRPLRP